MRAPGSTPTARPHEFTLRLTSFCWELPQLSLLAGSASYLKDAPFIWGVPAEKGLEGLLTIGEAPQ